MTWVLLERHDRPTPTPPYRPYPLHHLQRLEDIHAIEVSKADAAKWAALPQREREEKQVASRAGGRVAAWQRLCLLWLGLLHCRAHAALCSCCAGTTTAPSPAHQPPLLSTLRSLPPHLLTFPLTHLPAHPLPPPTRHSTRASKQPPAASCAWLSPRSACSTHWWRMAPCARGSWRR